MQAGEELSLAIHEAGHGPVGSIGVRVDDGDRDVAELGYVVARPARGRGIATRSVRLRRRSGCCASGARRACS